MKERVRLICGDVDDMWICTIHSMCVRHTPPLSRRGGHKARFFHLQRNGAQEYRKEVPQRAGLRRRKDVKEGALVHSRRQDARVGARSVHTQTRPRRQDRRLYGACTSGTKKQLKANNSLDFDDLLLYVLRLLRRDGEVREYSPTGSNISSSTNFRTPTPCSTK